MADVFISYQRSEREAVAIIADKLTQLRLDVWLDSKLTAGGTFDEEIATQLNSAKAVLTCWTPRAIASHWVRGEATLAYEKAKLVACCLEPTALIPPFNVMQTEDLTTWAGQEDAAAWLRILARVGQLVDRPGLASYPALVSPKTPLATLRAWDSGNGDDPLVEQVWARIGVLEGESAVDRVTREKDEARARGRMRKEQEARSRELAKARGIRAGRSLPARFVAIAIAVVLVPLLSVGYLLDSQRRERELGTADTPEAVRAFLASNAWHPTAEAARLKLFRLDEAAWGLAGATATIDAFVGYLAVFPNGTHAKEAAAARATGERVRDTQLLLARLGRYGGPPNGALDTTTRTAITTFQFEHGLVVTGIIDDTLTNRLRGEIERFTKVQPDELVAKRLGPPTLEEYRDIAARLTVDSPTLEALRVVETANRGFEADGRPMILFERHIFSKLTNNRFDTDHPLVSARTPGGYLGGSREWARLREAFALDPEAAYKATSFGMFQLLGMLHKTVGFETVGEYVRFVSQSEANQVEVFVRFAEERGILQPLRCLDWAGFARIYNGPGFARNDYDKRLRQAYADAAARFGVEPPAARPGCQSPGKPGAQ